MKILKTLKGKNLYKLAYNTNNGKNKVRFHDIEQHLKRKEVLKAKSVFSEVSEPSSYELEYYFSLLCRNNVLDEAISVFKTMKSKKILKKSSYHDLIYLYSNNYKTIMMERLFKEYSQIYEPDILVYNYLLKGFHKTLNFEKFEYYLNEIREKKINLNDRIYLLIFYYFSTKLEFYRAEDLFHKITKINKEMLIGWMTQEYLNRGELKKAENIIPPNMMNESIMAQFLHYFLLKEDQQNFEKYYQYVLEYNWASNISIVNLYIRYCIIYSPDIVDYVIEFHLKDFDHYSFSQIIYSYSLKGEIEKSYQWFEKSKHLGEPLIFNSMIKGAVENNEMELAQKVFQEYNDRTFDIFMYSTMIRGYLNDKNYEKAQYFIYKLTLERKMSMGVYMSLFNYFYENVSRESASGVLKQMSDYILTKNKQK